MYWLGFYVGQSTVETRKWSKSLSGLFSRMRLLLWACIFGLMTVLPSCGTINPLDLVGGGPNVAANVQAGKTNSQTIGTTDNTNYAFRNIDSNGDLKIEPYRFDDSVNADHVDTVKNTNVDMWMVILLILGWLAPSPGEIGRRLKNLFRK